MKLKKGIVILIFVVVISVFSHGCVEQQSTPPTTQKAELSLGQTALLDDIAFTVVKFEERDRIHKYRFGGDITPSEGAKFLFIYVKAKNIGEVPISVPDESLDIVMIYKGGEIRPEYQFHQSEFVCPTFESFQPLYHKLYDEKLFPNVTKEGWILFEVPKEIDLPHAEIRVNSPIKQYINGKYYAKMAYWSLT